MKVYNIGGWLFLGAALLGLYSMRWQPTPNVDLSPVYVTVADTVTYGDDRIVYKLPTDTARNANGDLRRLPDLSAAPVGARFRVLWKTGGDSVMVVTGDTFALSPLDSASATALASSWGVTDPHDINLAWHGTLDPVTGLTVQMASASSDTMEVGWNETTDDYQIISELGGGGGQKQTDTVSQTNTYDRVLTVEGAYQACVRTLQGGNLSDANCGNVTFDTTPDSLLAGGDLGSTYGMTIRDSTNIATILEFGYQDFPATDSEFPGLDTWFSEMHQWADSFRTQFTNHIANDSTVGLIGLHYYDKPKILYAEWWRTGDQQWKRAADSVLYEYYDFYVIPNSGAIPPRRKFSPGGWIYYFTHRSNADSAVRADSILGGLREMHDHAHQVWWDDGFGNVNNSFTDGRIQGRVAEQAMYMALFDSVNYGGHDWQTLGTEATDSLLSFHEMTASSIGVYRHVHSNHPNFPGGTPYCGGMAPFTIGHAVNYSMAKGLEFGLTPELRRDSVRAVIKGTADTIMDPAWYKQNDQTFTADGVSYILDIPDANEPCSQGDEGALPALNTFNAVPIAWYFKETGDSTYYHIALDSLITQGVGVYGEFRGAPGGCCPGNLAYNRFKEFGELWMQFHETLVWLHEGP